MRLEVEAQSQKGVLDRYFVRDPELDSEIKLQKLMLTMVMKMMHYRLRLMIDHSTW